jgi:hypothetical protein
MLDRSGLVTGILDETSEAFDQLAEIVGHCKEIERIAAGSPIPGPNDLS